MIAPPVERPARTADGDERAMLVSFLDWHRATLLHKCAGLDVRQLTEVTCPPSPLTLLGLVRHMARVERTWFRVIFRGEALDPPYGTSDRPTDWEVAGADPAANLATFQEEVKRAREAVAGRSLDETVPHPNQVPGDLMSLRGIYLRIIEEYARHNGHADLIRERIDGTTGL